MFHSGFGAAALARLTVAVRRVSQCV